MNKYIILILSLFSFSNFQAQESAGKIRQNIKKLGTLGSVLYFAAHPDDENTRIISYYSNEKLYETAYFSLTRGDGGQNLIGDEKGDLLGVIRTQELLQARNIDGGKQYFSRAVDFGYSKTVKETLEKWNEDSILYDAVWVIRQFQPDVIITRFPPDARAGHGHHTASAVVAIKAMDLAANPNVFPDQLDRFPPWQVKRIFVNTGVWWEPNIDSLYYATPGKYAKVNVGEYSSVLGKSYSEIAGMSRSQHKSQGFGASLSKGDRYEYLKMTKGDAFETTIMDDIDLTWNRTGDNSEIQINIQKCFDSFDENAPSKSITQLLSIKKQIASIDNEHWRKTKLEEIDKVISDCLGLVVEVLAEDEMWIQGAQNKLSFRTLNRSDFPIAIKSIKGSLFDTLLIENALLSNQWFEFDKSISYLNTNTSHPYWLRNEHEAFFSINDKNLTGVPEKSVAPTFTFSFKLQDNEVLTVDVPVIYKYVDRVKGELSHSVFISPSVFIHPQSDMILFKPGEKKIVGFDVTSLNHLGNYSFFPGLSKGWIGPDKIDLQFTKLGKPERVSIEIQAPNEGAELQLNPYVEINGKRFDQDRIILEYDHIESKMLSPKVKSKLLSLDVTISGEHIAYIEGAGDEMPNMLKEMGYHVTLIEVADLGQDISQYDALIFGVRAYNVHSELVNYHDNILEYTENGGRVVMQYNTSRGLNIELGPYSFDLSRNRVTDEFAKVTINNPKDPILNYPNKIDESDFENWVQERGLYFTDNWSDKYRAPLSWNDPGEDPLAGSLLVSDYGEGVFVYTSISFFRQLPAGVPGAYKLFSNIISGGKEIKKLELNNSKK